MTQFNSSEAEAQFREGAGAWRAGDFARARSLFEALAVRDQAPPKLWLLLAHSCRQLGDYAAEELAVDQVLALLPNSVQALIMKGDCLARTGKQRGAADFYRRAVDTAANLPRLPPELVPEVERARRLMDDAHQRFGQCLEDVLTREQSASGSGLDRFALSIDLLLGRAQRYVQQPTKYFFPGLADTQFHDPTDFAWAASVEAATGRIRAEYLSAMAAGAELKPFIATSPDHPPHLTQLENSLDWSAYHLFETGQRVDEHIAACPETWSALSALPLPFLADVAPSIFFSVLRPGAHIHSHHGVMNTRLVCHLPLIVPPDCGIRVGSETRRWEEGKLLIFNDAIEHEAWNRSDQPRVVLIFEIWRPELHDRERQAVTNIYEAIHAFSARS